MRKKKEKNEIVLEDGTIVVPEFKVGDTLYFHRSFTSPFNVEPCTIRKISAGRHTSTVEGKYHEGDVYVLYYIRYKYGYEMTAYCIYPSQDTFYHLYRTAEECMDALIQKYKEDFKRELECFQRVATRIGYTKHLQLETNVPLQLTQTNDDTDIQGGTEG